VKICMVAPIPPPYGGIGNWNLQLQGYCAQREELDFVCLNIAPKNQDLEVKRFWTRVVVKGFAMLKQRKELKKILARGDIDVMHLTTSGRLALIRDVLLLKLAKKRGVPTVYHIHFGRVPQIAAKNTFEWRMMKKSIQLATGVIAIDRGTLEAVQQAFPHIRVAYVPNPLDATSLNKVAKESETPKYITFLGWVVRAKGVSLLMKAWQSLSPKHRDWQLRIIGPCDDTYAKELEREFSLENVIFTGELSHEKAMALLSESEVFVLPSFTEGFPYSVLEAMALGRAIVATDVGAIPEMLAERCGTVIPSGDSTALEKALEALMVDRDLRETLGKNAALRFESYYTMERVLEQYKKIWSEVQNGDI